MKTLTEADLERIRAEARAVRDRALGLAEPVRKEPKPIKEPGNRSRKGIHISRPPAYNQPLIISLYKDGLRVGEIAEKTGAHRSTVGRILKQSGITLRADHGGPERREACSRGHSMEDALEIPGGGRACRKCKQARDRESYYRRKSKEAGAVCLS